MTTKIGDHASDQHLLRSGGRIWTCDLWVMSRVHRRRPTPTPTLRSMA